jgi:hypothetical protein
MKSSNSITKNQINEIKELISKFTSQDARAEKAVVVIGDIQEKVKVL